MKQDTTNDKLEYSLRNAAGHFAENINASDMMDWLGRSMESLRDFQKNAGINYLYKDETEIKQALDHLIRISICFMPEFIKCNTKADIERFLLDENSTPPLCELMQSVDETRDILVIILKALAQSPFTKGFPADCVANVYQVQTHLFYVSEMMAEYRHDLAENKRTLETSVAA